MSEFIFMTRIPHNDQSPDTALTGECDSMWYWHRSDGKMLSDLVIHWMSIKLGTAIPK